MKSAPFAYDAPKTVDAAVALLAEYGADAKVLAGGQSLVPLMNMRLARPSVLIEISRIASLQYIRVERVALLGPLDLIHSCARHGSSVTVGSPTLWTRPRAFFPPAVV